MNNVPGPVRVVFPELQSLWDNTVWNTGLEVGLLGASSKTILQSVQGTQQHTTDAVQGAVLIPSDSVNWEGGGIGGAVLNRSPITNAVALRGYCIPNADGIGDDVATEKIKCWPINTLFDDRGFDNCYGTCEWDFNVFGPDTQLIAMSIGGASSVDPHPQTIGFLVNQLGPSVKWPIGFGSLDHVCTIALSIGCADNGSSVDSQIVQMFSRDSGGNVKRCGFYGDQGGGFSMFAGPIATPVLISWSPSGLGLLEGGGGIHLEQLSSANDVTSQLLNFYGRSSAGVERHGRTFVGTNGAWNLLVGDFGGSSRQLSFTQAGVLIITEGAGELSLSPLGAASNVASQPFYQYARSSGGVIQQAILTEMPTGHYSLSTGPIGTPATYTFQADGYLNIPQSIVLNLLTVSRPVLTGSGKQLTSGAIDVGLSTHIAASGISSGNTPKWNGSIFVPLALSSGLPVVGDGAGSPVTGLINLGSSGHVTLPGGASDSDVAAYSGGALSFYTLVGLASNLQGFLKTHFDTIYAAKADYDAHVHSVSISGTTAGGPGHEHSFNDSVNSSTPV